MWELEASVIGSSIRKLQSSSKVYVLGLVRVIGRASSKPFQKQEFIPLSFLNLFPMLRNKLTLKVGRTFDGDESTARNWIWRGRFRVKSTSFGGSFALLGSRAWIIGEELRLLGWVAAESFVFP